MGVSGSVVSPKRSYVYYNPKDFQNNKIILHKQQIGIDYNNFRLPYNLPKPKQNDQMDTQLPPDNKIELAYGGIRDPRYGGKRNFHSVHLLL